MQKRTLLKGLHFYSAASGVVALLILQVLGLTEFNLAELAWIAGSATGLILWNAWRLTEL